MSTSPSEDKRELAERFVEGSRVPRTRGWAWLGWIALTLGALAVLFVLLRRRARAAPTGMSPEPTVDTPAFSFRNGSYQPTVEPDGTAVWSKGAKPEARASATHVKLARVVFPQLEDCVRDAAARLLRTHQVWFEGDPKTAPALARELRISAVRVPADGKDVTLHARHAAFRGHIVEIAVSPSGSVTYVGLLG